MNFELYTDVILLKDIPKDNLQIGDIGIIVESHHVEGLETGYSVEFFDLLGDTIAVVTVHESWLRIPTHEDRLTVRKENVNLVN